MTSQLQGWFAGRLPDHWFTAPAELSVDRDELLVVGTLAEPDVVDDADDEARRAARRGRIKRFREETRDQRMRIAREAERAFGRTVSWGAVCGDERELFTTLSVPVMTRLRLPERSVLDTLIDAGVARSRSDALAWCVRLVGKHEGAWLGDLRDAFAHVEQVRAQGPAA
jgi:hypothetical protein